MDELTDWRFSRILPGHVGKRREAPMRTLVLLAALAVLAAPTTAVAEEEGPKDQTTTQENIVVGGDFPGSFKIPGPDRPPPSR